MSELFKCLNGEVVRIVLDEFEDFEATVTGPLGKKIGNISFRRYDEEASYLKLTWMYLDQDGAGWQKQGIGREILRRVKEASGLSIAAGFNDGHKQQDGSHLTGDAPAFVAKMRQEQIIEQQPV